MTRARTMLLYLPILAIGTAIAVPLTFCAYLGYRMTRSAFRHPNITATAIAMSGMLLYLSYTDAGSAIRERLLAGAVTVAESPYRAKAQRLEERVRELERTPQAAPLPPPSAVQIPATPHNAPGVQSTDAYYLVRMHDTLQGIAATVTGDAARWQVIATQNGITDPAALPVGTQLRIPRTLCVHGTPTLYDQPLPLQHIVLTGSRTISSQFADPERILALNRKLGLAYDDAFPYAHGTRIVWYQ